MEVCGVCGASFDTSGYSITAGGRRYDSIECALQAQESVGRKSNAERLLVEAGRRRLGLNDRPLPPQPPKKSRK